MNLEGAKAAGKAFMEAKRGDVVSDEEILRRSQLCSQCPRKQKKVSTTTALSMMMARLAGKCRVPDKIAKFRCGACKCSFMLLIPSKTAHPDTPEERRLRWSNCWVLTPEEQKQRALEDQKNISHPTARSQNTGCVDC